MRKVGGTCGRVERQRIRRELERARPSQCRCSADGIIAREPQDAGSDRRECAARGGAAAVESECGAGGNIHRTGIVEGRVERSAPGVLVVRAAVDEARGGATERVIKNTGGRVIEY